LRTVSRAMSASDFSEVVMTSSLLTVEGCVRLSRAVWGTLQTPRNALTMP
jgi:hypothetical protein